jgi:hypothetical protein
MNRETAYKRRKMNRETAYKRRKLRLAIRIYRDWYEVDSGKGGGDPDCWPEIEEGLRRAKRNLDKVIKEVLP